MIFNFFEKYRTARVFAFFSLASLNCDVWQLCQNDNNLLPCKRIYHILKYVSLTLTELFPAGVDFLQIADVLIGGGGGINDVCVFGCDFVVFSKIKIVPIAEPLAGIRSFSDCNCVAKFCINTRISSLASCSDNRCSESFQIKSYRIYKCCSDCIHGALIVYLVRTFVCLFVC